ncbi:unnamed protein product [Trifolium pratense]|uniref:Uncharacterized protein n=1 Tax=Trifolium pratense TaxID=57577 RepID=A0ACB0LHY1_TRIPR|nr:unnamed protein product [Trifolium pratense]
MYCFGRQNLVEDVFCCLNVDVWSVFFLHFLYRFWIIVVLFLVQGSFSFGVKTGFSCIGFCCYALGIVVCFSSVLLLIDYHKNVFVKAGFWENTSAASNDIKVKPKVM